MADVAEISSKVFLDAKNNLFVLQGELENCENEDCQLPVFPGEQIFLKIIWSKVKSRMELYCRGCMINSKNENETYEVIILNIVEKVPKDLVPYFPSTPILSYTKSHADAIYKNTEAELIDRTRYSGKENYTFSLSLNDKRDRIPITEMQDVVAVQSGKEVLYLHQDTANRISSDDQHLRIDDALSILDSIKNEYVQLDREGNKLKQLEHHEEEAPK